MSERIYDVLEEMMETDRVFYTMARYLSLDTREQLIRNHLFNNRDLLSILRILATNNATFTVRLPLREVLNNDSAFWDPIRVAPTAEQINSATETDVAVTDTTCAICQEVVTSATRIRHCQHAFHHTCLMPWFELNSGCPVCRHDIRETQ
jgi:hypothetical protein